MALFVHSSLLPHFPLEIANSFRRDSLCQLKPKNPVSCPNFIPDTVQRAFGRVGSIPGEMTHTSQKLVQPGKVQTSTEQPTLRLTGPSTVNSTSQALPQEKKPHLCLVSLAAGQLLQSAFGSVQE